MSFKVVTEIVSGDCPSCEASTLLVNIGETNYRCVHCGNTLEQKVKPLNVRVLTITLHQNK